MFLEDRLLHVGLNTELDIDSIIKSVREMLHICWDNLTTSIGDNITNQVIVSNFKRVDRTLRIVAEKLKQEGKDFIKEDGFKIFVKKHTDLGDILD